MRPHAYDETWDAAYPDIPHVHHTEIYTTRHKPVDPSALPEGVTCQMTALPRDFPGINRAGCPRSCHKYGEFTTNRPLTEAEMERCGIKRVYLPA